eukprot:g7529.t2
MIRVDNASESWLKGLLALVAVALSTNILVGPTVRWRPAFVSGILGAMVACEYYHLFFAVLKLPGDWSANAGVAVERWDCLRSTKGGKRGDSSGGVYDINPCFCPFEAYCKNMTSGEWLDPAVCPKDGTAKCWDENQQPVDLYVSSSRDCSAAQGTRCTKEEPCTPCGLTAIEAFLEAASSNSTRSGVSRCRNCGAGNSGECNFVLDEGPYCWKEPGSKEVEPCSVCCTEPVVCVAS